ncbi:MAG: hypothetical protein MUO40_05290, partial [Anaerolineaceae bacterium]|nr:hypothetical protein [Anaerolineaceae bacterium]
TLEKMDGLHHVPRIPIEDCAPFIYPSTKSVTLSIKINGKYEKDLAAAVAAVYQDLRMQIDRYGIQTMIDVGKKAYG